MSKDGFVNENQIIEAINGRVYSEMNNNLQNFCSEIFCRKFEDNDTFNAVKPTVRGTKTDVIIKFDNEVRNISVKKGTGNSVHQEPFNVFVEYLKEQNVSINVLNALKLFHYGDGTIDDSGLIRLSAAECKLKYSSEISNINHCFNNKDMCLNLLDRFLFVGNVTNASYVDYIYYGTIESGIWATREEIINYFLNNEFSSDNVHVASLTYQVWGRDSDRKAKHPERRYVMQMKWGQLCRDLLLIKSYGANSNE